MRVLRRPTSTNLFNEWHEWHEDDAYAHDSWEDEQPDAEEHESVPEDLESAADQVEEAYATWQESRRLMNEMAKARGFYPVANKLEYMQALAWISQDGGGLKGKGWRQTSQFWQEGFSDTMEKRNWEDEHWSKQ